MTGTKHVVMFSGGIGSWATAKRVVAEHGPENVVLLFSDVKGSNESDHVGEDPDTYRFINDAADNVGARLVTVSDGRDIWQIFEQHRFLGNSRLAKCSHELKQKPARKWLEENCDPATTTIYVGIDWTETHRIPSIEKNYLPYKAIAPLSEPPYLSKQDMIDWAKSEGLKTPLLYDLGFAHNNCGGGCVRAGHGQFKKLLEVMPERFAEWEKREQHMREVLNKDVSILRSRVGGTSTPMTLKELRIQVESNMTIDDLDIGGCGCFTDFEEV